MEEGRRGAEGRGARGFAGCVSRAVRPRERHRNLPVCSRSARAGGPGLPAAARDRIRSVPLRVCPPVSPAPPLPPFLLAARRVGTRPPWPGQVPALGRPASVPKWLPATGKKRGAARAPLTSHPGRVSVTWRRPRGWGAARARVGGRRQPGGGRRGAATVTAAAGSRAEARAPAGEGMPRPAEARGCRSDLGRGRALLGSGGHPASRGARAEATDAGPAVRVVLARAAGSQARRPQLARPAAPAPATPRTLSRQPQPPAGCDFPDGAMLFFQDNPGSSPLGDLSRRPPPRIPRRFPPYRDCTRNSFPIKCRGEPHAVWRGTATPKANKHFSVPGSV